MEDIIHLLPDSVANQIAAGEVVQRPASIVKEMMENSIDADATEVQVLITDGGKTCVQIIDNGKGMSETDARMSFERHATSKINKATDLYDLHTMGFRGEALASIAAVAQIDLKTRRAEDELGTHIEIAGSRVERQEPVACAVGSNFSVRNLFYNIPARRKFLKTNQTELNNIVSDFQRIALVYPSISFTLVHNGTEEILFADMSLGSFLILPERPASDEELIKTIKEPKANIHYCYFEKEDLIVSYNYNTNVVSDTEYKMNVKYIIDVDAKTISDALTKEVIQDLNENKEYWVTWKENEMMRKQIWQIYENEFISPVDVFDVLSGDTDNNGVIDLTDLTDLSLALLDDKELTEDQKLASDVDGDGAVTLADLARLQQYLSKKIDKL